MGELGPLRREGPEEGRQRGARKLWGEPKEGGAREEAGQGNRGGNKRRRGARTKQSRPPPVFHARRFLPTDLSAVTQLSSVRTLRAGSSGYFGGKRALGGRKRRGSAPRPLREKPLKSRLRGPMRRPSCVRADRRYPIRISLPT